MAHRYREELVGKRFLSVKNTGKLKISKISEWEWRSGVIRVVSSRETSSPDFSVLVEFDDVDWQKREWIKIHEVFQVFLVEDTLVWAERPDLDKPRSHLTWPALCFKPLVERPGISNSKKKPLEYLLDRHLSLEEEKEIVYYKEGDENNYKSALTYPEVRKAVKSWLDYQDGQKILLTTPTVLVGYRVEVYRAEGTTQWYTAVIQSYNHTTKALAVTDDTVLEEHNEDPALTQMRLIDDGVVDSILRGVDVGIAPRRRPRNNNSSNSNSSSGSKEQQTHFTRRPNQPSNPSSQVNRTCNTGSSRSSKARQRHNSGSSVADQEKVQEKPSKNKPAAQKDRKRKPEADSEEVKRAPSPKKRPSNNDTEDLDTADTTEDSSDHKEKLSPEEESAKENCSKDKSRIRKQKESASTAASVSKTSSSVHKELQKAEARPTGVRETCRNSGKANGENRKQKSEKAKASKSLGASDGCESSQPDRTDNPVTAEVVEGNDSSQDSTTTITSEKVAHLLPAAETVGSSPERTNSQAAAEESSLSVEDNMHFKKQLLLSGNSASSSTSDSQPASIPAGIDLTRSVTEQIKFAKEKFPFNSNGRPMPESSGESVAPMAGLIVERNEKADTKPQELIHDRHRENSAFTSVQPHANAGVPRSNTTTPANEDRSDSRASDSRSSSGIQEEKRPSSRLDDLRSVKSSPASSPLIVDRNEPVHPYRDPELMRKSSITVQSSVQSILGHPKTMNQTTYPTVHTPVPAAPAGLPSSTSLSTHPSPLSRPLLSTLPYAHQLPPSLGGMSPHLTLPPGYAQLDPAALAARGLAAHPPQHIAALQYQNLMQLPYSPHGNRLAQLELLWQQKYPTHPLPQTWMMGKQQEELMGDVTLLREREMERIERERERIEQRERLEQRERERFELERIERERERDRREKERKERLERERAEREKAEREKAERERQEREKQERERAEKERQDRERIERERQEQSRREREREQRQERDRILRESVDTVAAVDQHFTESLRRFQGMWTAPSITKGTGKGLLPKTEPSAHPSMHALPLVTDKSDARREEERMKRPQELERERQAELSAKQKEEKIYLNSLHQQKLQEAYQKGVDMKDHKPDISRSLGPDSKGVPHGYPYPYTATGAIVPPQTSVPPHAVKQEPFFNLYGYSSQHPIIATTDQLQKHGLALAQKVTSKEEKIAQDVKMSYAGVGHHAPRPSSPRSKEGLLGHSHHLHVKEAVKPQSSVIVENKASVKTENPGSLHYGSSPASSPRPQPRPAHTPEHRPDRPLSSASSASLGSSPSHPHPAMAHAFPTSGSGMLQQSHPTAFRTPDSKSGNRSQSPFVVTSQQQQQYSSTSLPQPIDYCKSSSGKLKSQQSAWSTVVSTVAPTSTSNSSNSLSQTTPSISPFTTIAQPPVSLPQSSCSFALIQQGLVPNPIYSHGPSFSATKPATVQMTKNLPATVAVTAPQSVLVPSAMSNPAATLQTSPMAQQQVSAGVKRKTTKEGSGRKRQKNQNEAVPLSSTPVSSVPLSIPVTTPQIITNPSPYTTTSSSTYAKPGTQVSSVPAASPPVIPSVSLASNSSNAFGKVSGFMDSFKSFVENTVQNAFLADEAAAKEKSQQSQPPPVAEKMEVNVSTNEDTSSPTLTNTSSFSSSNMASIIETINRVANGQVDTDSDTLSAPSPPSHPFPDSSPVPKSAANHPNLKKAWLKRHSDEDKERDTRECSVGYSGDLRGNVKDISRNCSPKNSQDSNSEGCSSPACPSPASSLPNGTIADSHRDPDSTSSASDAESRCMETLPKKRTKTKKTSSGTKKQKTDEPPSNTPRKKPTNKRNKESKDMPKVKPEESPAKKVEKVEPEKGKPCTKSMMEDSPQPPSQERDHHHQEPSNILSNTPSNTGSSGNSSNPSNSRDKKKNGRSKEPAKEPADKNGSSFNKPLVKASVATLKRTCAPFIQDGSCSEITPKLAKCRECKMTPTQRSKKLPNIFCRFYAFRRLRYSQKGTVTIAGFSELSDADPDDIEPWLPKYPVAEPYLDVETSKFIIAKVGDKFCELVEQERQAKSWAGDDAKIAWKRAVTGVREMCDVCDTTLFNMHWVCHKCGFVVCLDCYKVRVNKTPKEETRKRNQDDEHRWLTCSSNRQAHEADKLMLTQIIPSDALWELGRLIHEIRRKWCIPAKCPCGQNTEAKLLSKNGMNQQMGHGNRKLVNGIGDDHGKPSKGSKKSNRYLDSNAMNGNVKSSLATMDSYNPDTTSSPLSLLADVASMDSESSRDRSDSPYSKRKSDHGAGKAQNSGELSSSENAEGETDKKTSTSCSTLRELLTKTAGKAKVTSENNKKPAKQKSSGSTLDDIIQSVVEKSCRDENQQPFKFLHYIPRLGGWQRDLPIMVHSLTETSVLYPDVPHSWLCDGKLLRLHDPRHKGNLRIFQEQWKRGQPVLVSGVDKHMDIDVWRPGTFSKEFGNQENDLVNCRTGNVIIGHPMCDFWDGFESITKRPTDDEDEPMLLKLKDWPPGDDFSDLLPTRFSDLMQSLPLPEYTHRQGKLNLASRLPDFLVRPDLGPKMYNAYGSASFPSEGTTNLHLDISDAVNVMVYVGIPEDAGGRPFHEEAALKAIDDAGCDSITKRRVREVHEIPGALWQIYHAPDADKIRDFLNKVAKERGETIEPDHDPIHDQSWYLDEELRDRLYKEYNVQGYTIVQCLGDAVFIPAGAPHQVRNLHSCIKVAEDFVSPEHLNHCFLLTQEFRQLSDTHSNHEDKLQVKNIIYHAVKDALAVLRDKDPEDE